jgi:hypothetical protein
MHVLDPCMSCTHAEPIATPGATPSAQQQSSPPHEEPPAQPSPGSGSRVTPGRSYAAALAESPAAPYHAARREEGSAGQPGGLQIRRSQRQAPGKPTAAAAQGAPAAPRQQARPCATAAAPSVAPASGHLSQPAEGPSCRGGSAPPCAPGDRPAGNGKFLSVSHCGKKWRAELTASKETWRGSSRDTAEDAARDADV